MFGKHLKTSASQLGAPPLLTCGGSDEQRTCVWPEVQNARHLLKEPAGCLEKTQYCGRRFVFAPGNVHFDKGRGIGERDGDKLVSERGVNRVLAHGQIDSLAGRDQHGTRFVITSDVDWCDLGTSARMAKELEGLIMNARRERAVNQENRFISQVPQQQTRATGEGANLAENHRQPL